jgi:predicted dehydrogenase/threonine dehydrogenase-like Zn-dependent dehydrogenase
MKQILQSLRTGSTKIADVPCPSVKHGQLLILTSQTLVSAGTERMLVEFGKASWIDKARHHPDKVKMVLDKIRTDGLVPTIETVFNKLDQPLPLGYCNVGTVVQIGAGVPGFILGDRVVSNGKHAEVVSVPTNLCAKVPDVVSDEEAVFTIIGSVALQGIRLAEPTLGEAVVVMGLGLVGLMAVQLLRANGCRVLGLDFDKDKLDLARLFGAEVLDLSGGQDSVGVAQRFSRGRGVDAVIVTAASKSSEPIHQAALMSRKRGRIILVGVTGLDLSREDFFKKELTFQVSASYGPGRYDPNYEERGQDYPVGFVRWTEQRNFEAVLDMMADGRLDIKPLISHNFDICEATKAYELISGPKPSLGVLLNYPESGAAKTSQTITLNPSIYSNFDNASLSFIGAGNYAAGVLMPAFREAGAHFRCVASSVGVTGTHAGHKFDFDETTTDTDRIFLDSQTNAIVITTQHDSHAHFVLQALKAGKHVFVEKPLCLNLTDLMEIKKVYLEIGKSRTSSPILMVGFNRRFAPQVQKVKHLIDARGGPKVFIMTVNAGAVSVDHWTQDLEIGGGRIIGEVCHFIDLLRFLAGASLKKWIKMSIDSPTRDTISLQLYFADGSIGTIHYLANGNKAFPKERLEVFMAGSVLQLDNYRRLTGYGWAGFKKMNLWKQDKGQKACAKAFVESIKTASAAPIPFDEVLEVSKVSIELAGMMHEVN